MNQEKREFNEKFMELLYSIRKFHMLSHKNVSPLQDTSRGQGRILAILRLKSKITAKDLKELGIIEKVLVEEHPASKDDFSSISQQMREGIVEFLKSYKNKTAEEIVEERYQRFRKY